MVRHAPVPLYSKAMASTNERPKAARTLFALVALIGLGYLCIRTVRFTNDFLDVAFLFFFFLIPFLASAPPCG